MGYLADNADYMNGFHEGKVSAAGCFIAAATNSWPCSFSRFRGKNMEYWSWWKAFLLLFCPPFPSIVDRFVIKSGLILIPFRDFVTETGKEMKSLLLFFFICAIQDTFIE